MRGKPILCLDFDGVIHSYASGWKGPDVIPDPPVAGAINFIRDALHHFRVAIYSSRSGQPGGIAAMQVWLGQHMHAHGMSEAEQLKIAAAIEWPTEKPPAAVTIDDRALTFDGTWPSMIDLIDFQPWNKRQTGATGDHPQGRLNADDQGGIRMGVAADHRNGIVHVDFGKPVAWLGLDKGTALGLADMLRKHAESLHTH
jgi:hypothetical protein